MSKTDLLKESIADAKTIKEIAMENARIALEESFTPFLKNMLSNKINEIEKEDDDLNEGQEEENINENEDIKEEEFNLDELLREIEAEEDEIPENPTDPNANLVTEAEDEESEDEDTDDVEGEEGEEEDEVLDLENLTEDELKSFIEEVISDMVEAGELEPGVVS